MDLVKCVFHVCESAAYKIFYFVPLRYISREKERNWSRLRRKKNIETVAALPGFKSLQLFNPPSLSISIAKFRQKATVFYFSAIEGVVFKREEIDYV